MWFRCFVAAAFGALMGLPVMAQTSGLDRLTLRDDLLGWEAVGRLELPSGYCTGVLIASDLVLTAGHCLFEYGTDTRIDPREITFRAGLRDDQTIAERTGARAVAHPRFDPDGAASAERIRHDVALIQLSQAIPTATAAPFVVTRLAEGDRRVSMVSYGRGRDEALSRQRACRVMQRGQGLFALNCDSEPGSSGAPVFDVTDRRARIVSIISGSADTDRGRVAYGMALPSIVADLRQRLRSGDGVWPAAPTAAPRRLRAGEDSGVGQGGGVRFLRP